MVHRSTAVSAQHDVERTPTVSAAERDTTLEGTREATGQCDQRAHEAESTEEASNESYGGLLDVNATAPARAK